MQNKLYRRPGSLLYWYGYTDGRGFPVEHCTGTANLTEAESVAAQLGSTAPHPAHRAPDQAKDRSGDTVEEAIAQFVSYCHLDRSAATVECYEQKGGHLVRLLGESSVHKLHVDHVHAYAHKRLEEGAARESVRKELVVLRSALHLARDRGIMERAPESMIPRFRAQYKPRQRWLSTVELSALLRHLEPHRVRWVMLAAYTGARLSEVESLCWGDIDFERGQIHIRGTKTARSDRHIPLVGDLAELLGPLRGAPSEPVAGTWHNVRRDLALACKKGRIDPVTPNDLRRTFASWLKQAGRDSLAVGRLLGHTSSRMVELVYGHLDQKTLSAAMDHLPSMASILGATGSDPRLGVTGVAGVAKDVAD